MLQCMYLFELWLYLDKFPRRRLLCHTVVLFYFLRNLRIVLHSGCTNLQFHQLCKSIPFSPTLSSLYSLKIFDDDPSARCEVRPHYSLYFYFPNNQWWGSSFPLFIEYFSFFFGEMSMQIICQSFNWFFFILSCMKSLYILQINPLSIASFAKIFSHSHSRLCLV